MSDPKRKYFEQNFSRQPAKGSTKTGYLQRPAAIGASAYRDELGDALSLQKSGAGITVDAVELTVDFDYNATFNANPALADYLYKNFQLNHDRDFSSDIDFHIHWFQAKNYSPNLLIEYRWQVNGAAKTTAWTKLKCNTLAFAYSAGTIHQISQAAGIVAPVNTQLSDIVQIRIYRDTGNASGKFGVTDPYNTGGNASVKIMSVDVHLHIDQIGSTQKYVK